MIASKIFQVAASMSLVASLIMASPRGGGAQIPDSDAMQGGVLDPAGNDYETPSHPDIMPPDGGGVDFKAVSTVTGTAHTISKVGESGKAVAIGSGRPGFNPRVLSSNKLLGASFDVQPEGVVVQASVRMMSRHQGPFHVWRLEATDMNTDAVVSDVTYMDQQFQMVPAGIMTVDFDEELPLPSGSYKIHLTLYRIPDGVGVQEMLQDADMSRYCIIISAGKAIQIP